MDEVRDVWKALIASTLVVPDDKSATINNVVFSHIN